MDQNNTHFSTFHAAAVGAWCIGWLITLMYHLPWLALLIILLGGPLLAWLLNWYKTGKLFS